MASTARARAPATPPRPRRAPWPWLKPAAVALGLAPLAKMALDGALGGLGANPIEAVQDRLGFWTLTLLAASLAPTPAHDLLGLAWPARLRRTLGLLAFTYGALHLAWYAGVDQTLDLGLVAQDVAKRPFITVGLAALLLLAPLAITSTDGWVRRLGYARWKRLHRLVYAAAALGVVHFLWRVKADRLQPEIFAGAFAALLLLRLPAWLRRPRRPSARRGPGQAAPASAAASCPKGVHS